MKWDAQQNNPYRSPATDTRHSATHGTTKPRVNWMVSLVLPFLLPILFYVAYQPFNECWTVRQFGCGCPSLDGTRHFNSNDFNTILWLPIALGCEVWFVRLTKVISEPEIRMTVRFIGGFGMLYLILRLWARTMWM